VFWNNLGEIQKEHPGRYETLIMSLYRHFLSRISARSAIIIMGYSTSGKGKRFDSYDSWIMHNIHLHEITCRNSDNYVPDDILQLQLVLHSVPFSIQTHTHIITGNQWNTRDKMCTSTHIPQSHHMSIKLQK